MVGLIVCIFFIVICLLGFPVSGSALAASLLYLVINGGNISFSIVTQTMVSGINEYSMLAVPMFILAGNIMNYGGVTRRIFSFCSALVGHIPGGLGQVNVLASMVFAGMSGSGTADAAGLGKIEIEAMKNEGYDVGFSAAVTAASACIGPIIPPSIPAVVYAVQAESPPAPSLPPGWCPVFSWAWRRWCFAISWGRSTAISSPGPPAPGSGTPL